MDHRCQYTHGRNIVVMKNNIKYSIVVPVFNSENTLGELVDRLISTAGNLKGTYELILVDDGSSDASWNTLVQIREKYPENLVLIKLTKNYGQHNALFCAFENARGNFIICIDDDLQIPPEEIPRLIDKQEESNTELVYGIFRKKRHSLIKNMGSKVLKNFSRYFAKSSGKGSSFKLIVRELLDKILVHRQNFVYIDELLLWYTDNIDYVEVEHLKRSSGSSGYTTLKLFSLAGNILIYYSGIPLRIMTYVGFLSSAISFAFGMRFIIRKVFFHVPLGYTSIIVAIFFTSSIILFSLGIIGGYLHRMYKEQNKKPPYSIKKIIR
jgi:polyisoprenyl-phosphate glycosyltransferase